jgi:2-iminobutanoate/2-iminopropanoate deaminase
MEIISSAQAPAAVGPYSQAIKSNGLLFCSGQLGIDPATGKLASGEVAGQAAQVFRNVRAVLAAASLDLSAVVKVTVFLVSLDDFTVVNELYAAEFGGHKPARSTVGVAALPLGALVEIECIAAGAGDKPPM